MISRNLGEAILIKALQKDFMSFHNMKGGVYMLEFTWKVFAETGSIDTYLLFKELEKEGQDEPMKTEHEITGMDFNPIS